MARLGCLRSEGIEEVDTPGGGHSIKSMISEMLLPT